jgi:hypothetical protein
MKTIVVSAEASKYVTRDKGIQTGPNFFAIFSAKIYKIRPK